MPSGAGRYRLFHRPARRRALAPRTTVGWLIGGGPDGDIVLERRFDGTSQDVRCLPNGKILFSQSMQGIVCEVNPDGSIHAAWHSRDKWIDKQPPLRGVERR